MAFRPPAAAAATIRHLQSVPSQESRSSLLNSPALSLDPAGGSDEWIVFSPSSVEDTTTVVTGGSSSNPLSQIIEIGSVDSESGFAAPRLFGHHGRSFDDLEEEEEEDDDDDDDDDSLDGAETDSLQPFNDLSHEGPVMLPMHDGMGTFQTSSGVISGLRSLEESLRIVGSASSGEEVPDTNARIQKWRMEQSQALLDEIEKVTRRRIPLVRGSTDELAKLEEEEEASMSVAGTGVEHPSGMESTTTTTTQSSAESATQGDVSQETFWKRITSLVRDIMGIDDALLQVLFGESLPAEVKGAPMREENKTANDAEERLVNRVARELGVLVNHYTSHPTEGAFSTPTRRKLDEAEEEEDDGSKTPLPWFQDQNYTESPRKRQRADSFCSFVSSSKDSSMPQFQFAPTLAHKEDASHAALWGIEEKDEATEANLDAQLRKEYWEQDLDVRVLFSFLKSRFSPRKPSPPTTSSSVSSFTPLHVHHHHHHPLINRGHHHRHYHNNHRQHHQNNQRNSSQRASPSKASPSATKIVNSATVASQFFGPGLFGLGGMRTVSSCASRSTKGKGKALGGSNRASSRGRQGYYWDVATSVGSGGSCVGVGVWADV